MSKRLRVVSMKELRAIAGLHPLSQIKSSKRRGLCSGIRGEASEHKALRAADGLVRQVSWLLAARAATELEEGDGKDIVIQADRYAVYVQVKSSRGEAKKFSRYLRTPRSRKGWLHGKCIVIVAGPAISIEKVMLEMLISLVKHREEQQ